jgi:hypothetical protein
MTVEAQGTQSRCENCGAQMGWDGATGRLKCEACGALKDVPVGGAVIEHDLLEALAARKPHGRLGTGTRQTKCQECGAVVEFPEGLSATRCSFCDSPSVLAQEARDDLIRPESLIPFATDRAKAVAAFKSWLGSRWFRPSDLTDKASVSELRSVYVPYWTFSAHVDTSWRAERGTRYQENESYVDPADQAVKTRNVVRVRWEWTSGWRSDDYREHLVCASQGLPSGPARDIARYDTSDLVSYAPEYLVGHVAETYALELADGWRKGQQEIVDSQLGRCRQDVGGDEVRNLSAAHTFSGLTFKHVLLPVWIAAFRYNHKVFRFLVNGQSGKVAGEVPRSWVKILLFALAVAAVVVLIVLLLHGRR